MAGLRTISPIPTVDDDHVEEKSAQATEGDGRTQSREIYFAATIGAGCAPHCVRGHITLRSVNGRENPSSLGSDVVEVIRPALKCVGHVSGITRAIINPGNACLMSALVVEARLYDVRQHT